jgi:glycosyltransferase involved in cell wall biosynthesis
MIRPAEAPNGVATAGVGPIRAAILLHSMAHGGVETAILNWCRTFDRDAVEPRLICFRNPGNTEQPFLDAAKNAGFEVERITWGRGKPVLKAARELVAYMRREECSVLHCHNTYANVVGLIASKMYPVKTITTMYVWGDFGFKRGALQWIDSWVMKRFDRVSAHCQSCFGATVARGVPAGELELLICGYPARAVHLDPAERARQRQALGATRDDVVLIYMARFWPEKAHDNLLEGFSQLLQRHPEVRLWLPGVGPELEKIRQLVGSTNVSSRVDFLGFYPDPDRLLALSDIQVHPSDDEGVALAICAGMNAGLPIVASRVGGLPEVLKDGTNSILIPPRSPAALADEVSRLIENPGEARRLGSAAQRFIQEEYSLEAATRKVESVYRSLVQQDVNGARR